MTTWRAIDALPAGKEKSVASAAEKFEERVRATGKVTMSELLSLGLVGRKTILKHIRTGELSGEKLVVGGKSAWLFEPEEAKRYAERAIELAREARRRGGRKAGKVELPASFLKVDEAASRLRRSKWFVYDRIADGTLPAEPGPYGTKMIPAAAVAALAKALKSPPRAKVDREPKLAEGPSSSRLYVPDVEMLVRLMLAQPELDDHTLADFIGAGRQTIRNWRIGHAKPGERHLGALVALARERYRIRVSDELLELAKDHRARYLRAYMAERRAERSDVMEQRRKTDAAYREANREIIREKSREYEQRPGRKLAKRMRQKLDGHD